MLFTNSELQEFKNLWLQVTGEVLSDDELQSNASAFVSLLYALTTGEELEVRYNNIALVNTPHNPLKQ